MNSGVKYEQVVLLEFKRICILVFVIRCQKEVNVYETFTFLIHFDVRMGLRIV